MYSAPTAIVLNHGTFNCILLGEERGKAHAALLDAFCKRDLDAAQRWVVIDRSLFVEPITPDLAEFDEVDRYPVGRKPVWDHTASFFGTWANAAAMEMPGVVLALLDAGLHPDEPDVFLRNGLLAGVRWHTKPHLLRAALAAGASVPCAIDRAGIKHSGGYLRPVLLRLAGHLAQAGKNGPNKHYDSPELGECIECAHILMDAGDRFFDIPLDKGSAEARQANRYTLTALHIVTSDWPRKESSIAAVKSLVDRMIEAGADVDRLGGMQLTTPVVYALRMLNIEAACHLIGRGARIDDAFLVRPANGAASKVGDIYTEARKAGGDAYVAAVTEAVMRRRVALEVASNKQSSASNDSVAEPVRRRRIAV